MTLVAGIDPGTNGACAVYCSDTKQLISVEDMPFWYQTVNKKQRRRVDPIGLLELFEMLNMMGVKLIVMEAVGGRPRQSASAGFVFGYTVGLTYMAAMTAKIMVDTVTPQTWKKLLNISGKTKAEDDDIINRAYELFPHQRDMFRDFTHTKAGRKRVDRAEAAMLAKFGGDYALRTLTSFDTEAEFMAAHRKAETGA